MASRTPSRSQVLDQSVLPNRGPSVYGERIRGRSLPRRARTGHVVVERVVDRAAPASNFPILSKTNYADWTAVMRVMLQVRVLWDAVNIGMMDFTEDRLALEALSRAVPLELSGTIAGKATTHITWEGIKTSRVGDDRVRKSKAGTLKQEFDALKFRSGEMVDDFAMRITSIANRLSVLGEGIEEEVIEQKFL
jgi:hypothetical protein